MYWLFAYCLFLANQWETKASHLRTKLMLKMRKQYFSADQGIWKNISERLKSFPCQGKLLAKLLWSCLLSHVYIGTFILISFFPHSLIAVPFCKESDCRRERFKQALKWSLTCHRSTFFTDALRYNWVAWETLQEYRETVIFYELLQNCLAYFLQSDFTQHVLLAWRIFSFPTPPHMILLLFRFLPPVTPLFSLCNHVHYSSSNLFFLLFLVEIKHLPPV